MLLFAAIRALALMYKIGVPAVCPSIWDPPAATRGTETVFPALLPDQGDAATNAGDLCGLGVSLHLAVTEVQSQLELLLRREVLVAKD